MRFLRNSRGAVLTIPPLLKRANLYFPEREYYDIISAMMRRFKSLLLTMDYPPIEGGIAVSLQKFWSLANPPDGMVLAPGVPGAREFDRAAPNRVLRFPCISARTTPAKILNFLSLTVAVLRILLTHSVEHLHCGQLLRTGILGYLRKLLTGRDYFLWVYGGETRPDFFNNPLAARLNARILRAARKVVTNSPFTSREFIDYGLEVLEILPGVDTQTYFPMKKKQELVKKFHLQGKKVLLTCGRLVERKGHDKVLEAMGKILKEVPEVVYLIVGDGPHRTRLEELARQYGVAEEVRFVGLVDPSALPDYYNLCDLFIMPNRAVGSAAVHTYSVEGLGMVFLEAAACGKPVIGGDSGGAVYAVAMNVNGFLVPPEDVGQIVEKAIALFKDKDLYEKFSRNGREYAKKFSWECSVEKLRPYL